jgi:hypothetical protein
VNRKVRRKLRRKSGRVALDQIDHQFDIQVEAKFGQIVMIFANAKGRKLVEDLWPGVRWTTDEHFSSVHSPDWLFTHICVTKLPPHLESKTPLAFASPDQLGIAVSMALQRLAEPRRVVCYIGTGPNIRLNVLALENLGEESIARSLFAEYVPAGTRLPTGLHATDAIQ